MHRFLTSHERKNERCSLITSESIFDERAEALDICIDRNYFYREKDNDNKHATADWVSKDKKEKTCFPRKRKLKVLAISPVWWDFWLGIPPRYFKHLTPSSHSLIFNGKAGKNQNIYIHDSSQKQNVASFLMTIKIQFCLMNFRSRQYEKSKGSLKID